jgi:hypothetical protein
MNKNPCMGMRPPQVGGALDEHNAGKLGCVGVLSPFPSKVDPVLHHPSA